MEEQKVVNKQTIERRDQLFMDYVSRAPRTVPLSLVVFPDRVLTAQQPTRDMATDTGQEPPPLHGDMKR